MKSSKELKEERNDLLQKMDALVNAAETEKRQFTDADKTSFNALEARAEDMKGEIEMQEKIEKRKAEKATTAFSISSQKRNTNGENGEKKEISRKYSLSRAIRSQGAGRLDGLEREMSDEQTKIMSRSGLEVQGIGIPGFIQEKRDHVVGTATAGGHTVETELGGLIGILQPKLQTIDLGATLMTGLRGNVDFPRNDGDTVAVWEGEQDENAETTATFDKISFTPNRLGAKTHFSKQLLAQSSISVDSYLRSSLETAMRKALDLAAINGSGSGNIPKGILNQTGIGSVVGGTNGLAPTYQHMIDLETALAVDNADMGSLGYLTTPGVRGKLKGTETASGNGIFVWNSAQELNGYRAVTSTQVPSDLTKGTSSGVAHAAIFGNWADLMIGQWGEGFDLVVDPYTLAGSNTVRLILNGWFDIDVRHVESFAAMKDALVS